MIGALQVGLCFYKKCARRVVCFIVLKIDSLEVFGISLGINFVPGIKMYLQYLAEYYRRQHCADEQQNVFHMLKILQCRFL